MSDFSDVTAVRRRPGTDDAAAVYDADLHERWAIGGKPNGGYLLAILARAGCDIVETTHPLAITGHYLRAPNAGPAEIRAEVIRKGRRASTARAVLWQDGKSCIDATVTSGELHEVEAEWNRRTPPTIPPPEDCAGPEHQHFVPELFEHVELRIDPATAPFPDPNGEPTLRYWIRLRDGSPADVMSLILCVDAGPPTVFHLSHYGWAPTVELTVLLRGIPAPGWLLCESHTDVVADGWFDESTTLWDSTGRVVAQSTQLALSGTRRQLPS